MDDNNQNELQEEQKCWNNCNSRRSEFYLYCTKQFHVTYHACHCSLGTIFSRGLVSSDPFFPVTQYLADDLLMWPSWCAEGSGLLMLHCYDLRGSGLPHLQHPTDTGLHHCDHLHRNIHHLEPLLLKWNSIKLYFFPKQGRGQGERSRHWSVVSSCYHAFLSSSPAWNPDFINLLPTLTNSSRAHYKAWRWSSKHDCHPYFISVCSNCAWSSFIHEPNTEWHGPSPHLTSPDLSLCLETSDIGAAKPSEGASPDPVRFICPFVWWILFSVFAWEGPMMLLPLT